MNSVDRVRIGVAAAALAAFAALVLVLGMRAPEPAPVNGDQLGQNSGETFEHYQARAHESLTHLNARSPERHYALIAFQRPLTAREAGETLDNVGRVNAMVIGAAAPRALPEPIPGENRGDVFERELDRIAEGLSGLGNVPVPEHIEEVVVWDTAGVLMQLADDPRVATVEALPSDARWGFIGVMSVDVPAE